MVKHKQTGRPPHTQEIHEIHEVEGAPLKNPHSLMSCENSQRRIRYDGVDDGQEWQKS